MRKQLRAVPSKNVALTGSILGERQRDNDRLTIPHLYEQCMQPARYEALRLRWDGSEENRPHPFWDSDIGKMIEAASYALMRIKNPELERQIDQIIDLLAQAQEEDGYLNTYYQICEPRENRWTNLFYMHELYCMGHLIEGAVAYFQATGKRKLLDVMIRYADLACSIFGPGGPREGGYGGHPEVELALVRLYEVTGERRYLELSSSFIDHRGTQPYYFELESLRRGVDSTKTANKARHLKYFLEAIGPYAEYQAHKPLREQSEPIGHAVRAMYLLAGMADVADHREDQALYQACLRIWKSLVSTRVAITGGIGVAPDGERFTFAYDIPNEYTYNESCASVGLVMAAGRLLRFSGDADIADWIEQTLYNTVLAGVSADARQFFYSNYLSVCPERFHQASKAMIDKAKAERQPWFTVACCPPNISRLIGNIGEYLASLRERQLYLHLYTACHVQTEIEGSAFAYTMETDYPRDGRVLFTVEACPDDPVDVLFRIPRWCKDYRLRVQGRAMEASPEDGYVSVNRQWQPGDEVELVLSIKPHLVESHPRLRENCGKLAIMRGPLVYCLEEADNGADIADIRIESDQIEELHGEICDQKACLLKLKGRRRAKVWASDELYSADASPLAPADVIALPYYLWGNRGFGEMAVWISDGRS